MAREILQTRPSRDDDGLDFHHLLETMPEAAYSTNAEGFITYFNRRAAAVWGREPRRNDPFGRY